MKVNEGNRVRNSQNASTIFLTSHNNGRGGSVKLQETTLNHTHLLLKVQENQMCIKISKSTEVKPHTMLLMGRGKE